MIRRDMPVIRFVAFLWEHKIKVGLLFLALAVGPGLYDDWQKKRAAEQLVADRMSVDTDASFAGMHLVSAWAVCSQIGIVNDIEGCAQYQARLLQEKVAPIAARTAIERRDSYYKKCQRFYAYEYCVQLLARSVALSNAQRNNNHE